MKNNNDHIKRAGFRKRLFAWVLKKGDRLNYQLYHRYKSHLFAGIQGLVVEIGPGSGVNLAYLPSGVEWMGIEPNPALHGALQSKLDEKGIYGKLLPGDASAMPLEENQADYIICTLVLCSVKDPALALREIKRVLKPGGKLILIEHVLSQRSASLRLFQNLLNPVNKLIADGCHCNRITGKFIEDAGFSETHLDYLSVRGTLAWHRPHIIGYVVK